jgi:hypothetical protein
MATITHQRALRWPYLRLELGPRRVDLVDGGLMSARTSVIGVGDDRW